MDFGTGALAGGELILDNSASDTPYAIFGFDAGGADQDKIDLKDIDFDKYTNFNSVTPAARSTACSPSQMERTKTVASLYLIGNFNNKSFTLMSDGHNGTLIT